MNRERQNKIRNEWCPRNVKRRCGRPRMGLRGWKQPELSRVEKFRGCVRLTFVFVKTEERAEFGKLRGF